MSMIGTFGEGKIHITYTRHTLPFLRNIVVLIL
jgi:hypothetical protein